MLLVIKIVIYCDQEQAFYFEIWKIISGIKLESDTWSIAILYR